MKVYCAFLIGVLAVFVLENLGVEGFFLIQWQWWLIIISLLLVGEAIDRKIWQ